MRVRQVAGAKYLVWPDLLQQITGDLDILFTHRLFFHGAGLVKGKILEMNIFLRDAYITAGSLGFAAADQAFQCADLRCVHLVAALARKVTLDVFKNGSGTIVVDAHNVFETHGKINEPRYKLIGNG